jgi:hypothetical protein
MSTTTTSSRSGRPGSDILYTPPTDPTGFIYSSYRAVGTEASRDEPSLESSHQDVAYVSSSVGGSVSTLCFEDTPTRSHLTSRRCRGGGIRDTVRGFSRSSRTNLLRRLASINRSAFRAFKGRIIFVTLTYPSITQRTPNSARDTSKRSESAFRGGSGPSLLSGDWAYSREAHGISTCSCSRGHLSEQ